MIQEDNYIIQQLHAGDIETYETVYKQYFQPLHKYARTMLDDDAKAEDIVQGLFIKLWEKAEQIEIRSSLKAYLYKSVYHASLNAIKSNQVEQKTKDQLMQHVDKVEQPLKEWDRSIVEKRITSALAELPEQCRTVFQMSRFEHLKYREIADQLRISPKTVEQHMTKALKMLRASLVDLLLLFIIFSFTINSIIS